MSNQKILMSSRGLLAVVAIPSFLSYEFGQKKGYVSGKQAGYTAGNFNGHEGAIKKIISSKEIARSILPSVIKAARLQKQEDYMSLVSDSIETGQTR